MKIGFVGLGIMGRPMALNLRKAGYELWVHARREISMQPLVEAGAKACGSPQEVAEQVDVTFTMVSATADVEQVVLGERGIIHGVRAGSIVVDMSTISPGATRRMAEKLAACGVDMLDAPVSGGEVGAIDATLSIMVGGKAEVLERIKPLLVRMGNNIVHIGDHGAGQVAKACNNLVVAINIEAVAEALTFARRCGVDAAKVRDAMMGGFASSRVLKLHGKRILKRDFKPGFKVALHKKDLHITLEEARQMGLALPGTALVAQHLNALIGAGDGELDSAAIVKAIERLSGITVE